MNILGWVVPAAASAIVATLLIQAGIPEREDISLGNTTVLSGDMIRVTLPDGSIEVQHVINAAEGMTADDLRSFIAAGHISCTWTERDGLGRPRVFCRNPFHEFPAPVTPPATKAA